MQNNFSLLRKAIKILKLPELVFQILSQPKRVFEINFPVKMDNNIRMFHGFRVQWNNVLGPYKGGIRYHPTVTRGEVETLAWLMTLKCSLMGLPFGGAKGGVIVDPKKLSKKELERLTRGFTRNIADLIGPKQDVPAPDVGTDGQIMLWLMNEYSRFTGQKSLAVVTGKPLKHGGSQGREEATGYGGFVVLSELLKIKNKKFPPAGDLPQGEKIKNKEVVVQGFGNVGLHFAQAAYKAGYIIKAIADSKGAIKVNPVPTNSEETATQNACESALHDQILSFSVSGGRAGESCGVKTKNQNKAFVQDGSECRLRATNEQGLDLSKVMEWKKKTGSVVGFPGTKNITQEQLLVLPCDILIPAALENQITEKNVDEIKAKIILELANGPITMEASQRLWKKRIIVVPDILANGGGVTTSFFEWKQNLLKERWSKEKVLQKLSLYMRKALREVLAVQKQYKIDMRLAAYLLAVQRIAKKL